MIQQCLRSLLIPALPPLAGAGQGLSARSTPSPATHQPHHQVGEDSNPERGDDEGEHEELLPAGLAAVGDGDAQEEDERPGEHPLDFVPSCLCRGMGGEPEGRETVGYTPATLPARLPFHAKQEDATNMTPSNGLCRMTPLRIVNLEVISAKQMSVC